MDIIKLPKKQGECVIMNKQHVVKRYSSNELIDLNRWFIHNFLKNYKIVKYDYHFFGEFHVMIKNDKNYMEISRDDYGHVYFYYQTRHFNKCIEVYETDFHLLSISEFILL